MKQRHVFLTTSLEQAQQAVQAATRDGIADDDIYLVARKDIELRHVGSRRQMADSDFIPAALRGALVGGAIGLALMLAFQLYRDVGAAWFALGTGLCAVVGALGASLMGATMPDPIRQHFAEQIDRGDILVVLDAEEPASRAMDATMEGVGASRMPYRFPSSMT